MNGSRQVIALALMLIPWHMLAGHGLCEEGVEGVVRDAEGGVGGHGAVGPDAVLQAEQLPRRRAHLASRLAHVDVDHLAHCVQTLCPDC